MIFNLQPSDVPLPEGGEVESEALMPLGLPVGRLMAGWGSNRLWITMTTGLANARPINVSDLTHGKSPSRPIYLKKLICTICVSQLMEPVHEPSRTLSNTISSLPALDELFHLEAGFGDVLFQQT